MDQKESPGSHLKIRKLKIRMELHKMRRINAEDETSIKAEREKIGEAIFLKQFKNLAEQSSAPSHYSALQIVRKLRRMSSEPCITPHFLHNEVPQFFSSIFECLSKQDQDPALINEVTWMMANLTSASGEENIKPLKQKSAVQVLWVCFKNNLSSSDICVNILKAFTNLCIEDEENCFAIIALDLIKYLMEEAKEVTDSVLIQTLQLFKAAVQTLKGKFLVLVLLDVITFTAQCLKRTSQAVLTAGVNLLYDLTNELPVACQYSVEANIHHILENKYRTQKQLDLITRESIILIFGNLLTVDSESTLYQIFKDINIHSFIANELFRVSTNEKEITTLGLALLFAMCNLLHSDYLLPYEDRLSQNEDFIQMIVQYSDHPLFKIRKQALFNIQCLLTYTPYELGFPLLKVIQKVLMNQEDVTLLLIALQAISKFIEKDSEREHEQHYKRKQERADALRSLNFVQLLESLLTRVKEERIIEQVTDLMDAYLFSPEDSGYENEEDNEMIDI